MTTTKTTWPDAAHLDRLSASIVKAYDELDELHLIYYGLAEDTDSLDNGTQLPTFEELGRLSAFITGCEMDLEGMGKHLEQIREAHDAAGARMQDNARLAHADAS